jgi:excisionase family DNA binding protein
MTEPPHNPDPLMTLDEAADYLGSSARFVRKQIAQGTLEGTFLGRLVRVRRSALERFIETQTRTLGPA